MSDCDVPAGGASAAGSVNPIARYRTDDLTNRALGCCPACSLAHTDHTTMGETETGTRNLGQALSAAAGGSQLAEVFAREADESAEAAAVNIYEI